MNFKVCGHYFEMCRGETVHIFPFRNLHRIGGAPPDTFPNVKYDAPEEVGGTRIFFKALLGNEVWSKFFILIVSGP